jgi:hypothetical protein
MPLLTDVTMTDFLLTDQICADFAHLPLLRHLHGVIWPIDIDPPDSHERMTTVDPRMKHFPSLTALSPSSEATVLREERYPWVMRRECGRVFDCIFPLYDLCHFLQSLPQKLQHLKVDVPSMPSLDLSTFGFCLDALVARESEERRLDAAYLSAVAKSARGTASIRVASEGAPVRLWGSYQQELCEQWQSLSAAQVYRDRSFEELRLGDYEDHADLLAGEAPLEPGLLLELSLPPWSNAELKVHIYRGEQQRRGGERRKQAPH